VCADLIINGVEVSHVDSMTYLGTNILAAKHWRIDITPRRRKFFCSVITVYRKSARFILNPYFTICYSPTVNRYYCTILLVLIVLHLLLTDSSITAIVFGVNLNVVCAVCIYGFSANSVRYAVA